MLISLNWLRTLIDTDLDAPAIADLLTNTGLEVEKFQRVDTVPGGLEGLVVGEVLTCVPHPNAERLRVTSVDIGTGEALQIVCGAPNVAAGQKVIVAPVGTTIYPTSGEPFEIGKAKIRGESSRGMICAEDEIGLGANHDGILILDGSAVVGSNAKDLFNIDTDYQFEIGLTPNRGDGASHLGAARDIFAVTGTPVTPPAVPSCEHPNPPSVKVQIDDLTGCPRYSGIVLTNVSVHESPDWLKSRLRSIGLKPINNVVDVTNFVLHELGQPIHAFDADKISDNKIIVRKSTEGERFTTLDEVERTLTGNELMIADPSRPLAIAGVFGGLHSGVTAKTTRLFIESAFFDMTTIRKSAKTQGLSTDASFRYERGCDPEITIYALQRVVGLLMEVAGAQIESGITDTYPTPLAKQPIQVDLNWLNTFCGTLISSEDAVRILERLDCEVTLEGNLITVYAPRYRSDVTRDVDIAEEILRIYGYNQVEIPSRMSFTPAVQQSRTMLDLERRIANYLTGQGFLEIMNNSQTRVEYAAENAVAMLNPLSQELAVMRTSLQPAVLDSIAHNLNRKNQHLKFFELGKTYGQREDRFFENNQLMLAATGSTHEGNWTTPTSTINYFHIKGWLEGMISSLGLPSKLVDKLCSIETVSKSELKQHGIKQEVITATVAMDALLSNWQKSTFTLEEVPVFPIVTRDLSLVMDKSVSFKEIDRRIQQVCGTLLRKITVFDVYVGDRISADKKAYACSIQLYNSKKTLTDDEVDAVINKVIRILQSDLGIELRTS